LSSKPASVVRLAYAPKELPAVLGVSRGMAYELAKLLGRRIGRRVLVPAAALEKWLARGRPLPGRPRRPDEVKAASEAKRLGA
jgi:hypothetical protein